MSDVDKLTKQQKRRRKLLRWAGVLLVITVYLAWPGRHTFKVGIGTTRVTGPLDADGFVDYDAVLNAEWYVPPAENAGVIFLQIVGSRESLNEKVPNRLYEQLGIPPLPDDGPYLVNWYRHSEREPLVGYQTQDELEHEKTIRTRLDERFLRCGKNPWIRADEPSVWHWLELNREPLKKIDLALSRSKFFSPWVSVHTSHLDIDGYSASMSSAVRKIAEVLQIRAMLRIGELDREGAWHDIFAIQKIGRLLTNCGQYHERLAGMRMERDSMDLQRSFLERFVLSREQILACRKQVESLPTRLEYVEMMDRARRYEDLDFIMRAARRGRYLGYENGCMPEVSRNRRMDFWSRAFTPSVDWDEGLIQTNRKHDELVNELKKTQSRRAKWEFIDRWERDHRNDEDESHWQYRKWYLTPSGRGVKACEKFNGLGSRLRRDIDNEERFQMELDLMRVAYALEAYLAEYGNYPQTLVELVPGEIDRIPADLFSLRLPLNYSSDGMSYQLYSVGTNSLDDHGRTYTDEPRGDDLVIRMGYKDKPSP